MDARTYNRLNKRQYHPQHTAQGPERGGAGLSSLLRLAAPLGRTLRHAPGVFSRLLSSEPGEQVISIDRSGLGRPEAHSQGVGPAAELQGARPAARAAVGALVQGRRLGLAGLPRLSQFYRYHPATDSP